MFVDYGAEVGNNAEIGDNCRILSGAVVHKDAKIPPNSEILPIIDTTFLLQKMVGYTPKDA